MDKNKEIILYYCVTHYHLLCSILHKLKYHKTEKAVVCFPARNNDCDKVIELLRNNCVFDKIYLYEEYNYTDDKNLDCIIEEINKFIKEKFPISIACCKEINVFSDTYSFGIYLAANQIPYNFFEDGRGRLSTEEQLLEHIEKIFPGKKKIIEKLQLFGNSTNVIARYGDLTVQEQGYYNKKDIHFSTSEILEELDDEELNEVLRLFGVSCKNINYNDSYAIILTQHYVNLNLMSMEEQKNIYLCMADYFSGVNKLIIKPHPSDIHGLYRKWFPNAIVLDRFFPAELIPYCIDKNYEVGMAVSSTAIYGLEKQLNISLCFNQMMEKTYCYMHKYFVALETVKKIATNSKVEILTYGLNSVQMEGLNKFYSDFNFEIRTLDLFDNYIGDMNNELDRTKIIIIDQIDIEKDNICELINKLYLQDIIIFLDTGKTGNFVLKNNIQMLDWVFPIEIQMKTGKSLCEEYIYIYSKNVIVLKEIVMLDIKKILQYSDTELVVNQSDKTEIKILKGINEALENRIVDLVKAYNELENNNKN